MRPTNALTAHCEAEDIGEEKAKLQEPAYIKPTSPVIPERAVSNPSKLSAAIEAARQAKEAKALRLAEERDRLDASLLESEPPRDELVDQAEAMLSAATNSPEAKEAARLLHTAISQRQEMIRNVHQVMGVTTPQLLALGENDEETLRAIIASNGALREAIRHICEAAGTVRVSKPVIVDTSTGGKMITFRHVDVGDEEPEQEPMVDMEYLLPASLRAAARFRRLIAEHDNAVKQSADASYQFNELQQRSASLVTDNRALRDANAALEAQVKEQRPAAPGTPGGYFLRTEAGLWVAKYEGKQRCFVNGWMLVTNPKLAHSFEFKQDAQELLARLQFSRVHRIGKTHRETLSVVTIRYEDHSE